MESSVDVSKKIAEALNWKLVQVENVFDVEEDKQGFFILTLKPKRFLDPADFKAVCRLTQDLGGDGEYAKVTRSWKVPGSLAKKPISTPVKKSAFEILPLAALVSMPFQSRELKNDPSLDELVESIKETGVVEPIVVRGKGGFYEIVMGERRVEASRRARCGDIPAIVKSLSDEQAYDMQLVENIQRKDLSDMETAHALKWRIDTFGYTQDVLAKKLGKSHVWVSRHLSMLELEKLTPGKVQLGEITERQAREILAAPPDKQEKIIDEINKTGEVPSARELHLVVHPEEKPKTILCDHCGEPVESPVHVDGKFYHDDCYEQVKAESAPGLAPETPTKFEPETVEPEKKPKHPEPELTGYLWTCPCGAKFIINHVDLPGGRLTEHHLEACGA